MLDINKLVEESTKEEEYKGQCIVLEEKQGWVRCRTISSGKVWDAPLKRLADQTIRHEDGSFSFENSETKSPFDS